MYFRTFFDEKLAQYSYMVGCQRTGEAIVIDPARHIAPYEETAKKEGFRLTAAAETHIHADFVSGAHQMAKDHGSKVFLSDEGDEDWKYKYIDGIDAQLVKDGDAFKVGNIEFKVMHTPGHTPEHISFVLTDKGGGSHIPMGIFTGDFVFVGDVGRPDLLEKAAGVKDTANTGAIQMFHSLKKFKELPDHLVVWPGHGAGSACGKALGAVPMSTAGYEKQTNWALQHTEEDAFVKELLADQPEPPKYFAMMKKVNKEGPSILTRETVPVIASVHELEKLAADENTFVIDTRPAVEFANGHIEGTINMPYTKIFTNWAGWLTDYDQSIVIIAPEYNRKEIQQSLESIGLDRIVAFADTEVIAQSTVLETYKNIDVNGLKEQLDSDDVYVIDIRQDKEWNEGHIPGAHHHMLGYLKEELHNIPKDKKIIVHCQSGARSAIGTSYLQAAGFKQIENMAPGFAGWQQ
ncbi:MBL fold metallo-hydrolase [Domibacillus antri]|uniref:MBL fold metallo-hydrolase n=1 Tax=Domibacillus antri TaxID=1714264 RepID=A0A1Q8Q9M0_9BACI|nr:rhodanese-like domain-containing protein [Domibacillus antri]OLN24001.1 MBL fold metallo-hydrolase [Domibacillus antri]